MASLAASCDEEEAECLDPRVGQELERLNALSESINALEVRLEEANVFFRTLLSDSTQQLKAVANRVGKESIEKARPYFDALEAANRAQKECQSAATHYQRAHGVHAAAKETIALAEERFLSHSGDWAFDNAWQEMLNHATIKVMEAERLKTESEAEHERRAANFCAAENETHRLEKTLRRFIIKSKPYFDHKDAFNRALEAQKRRVQDLQAEVSGAKKQYAGSLRRLEEISESIHARRRKSAPCRTLMEREPGVGAEEDHDMSFDGPSFNLDECDRGDSGMPSGASSSACFGSFDDVDDGAVTQLGSRLASFDMTRGPILRTRSCPSGMSSRLTVATATSDEDSNSDDTVANPNTNLSVGEDPITVTVTIPDAVEDSPGSESAVGANRKENLMEGEVARAVTAVEDLTVDGLGSAPIQL